MLKITTSKRVVVPSPHAAWSLSPGIAAHFDEAMPDTVAKQFAALEGIVKVETLGAEEKPKAKPKNSE